MTVATLRSPLRGLQQRPLIADALLAAGMLVAGLLPLGVRGVDLGELPNIAAAWVAVVLIVALTLPLSFRRVYPAGVALVVSIAWVATQFAGTTEGIAGLSLLIAIYSVSAHQRQYRVALAIAGTAAYVGVAIGLSAFGSHVSALGYVTFFVVLLVPCLIGRLVRSSVALQEERRQRATEEAVQEVLRDLALDLHDVVTHHVTAIVVQAESAAYLDDADREGRDETLRVVAAGGRRALGELRELLGVIDPKTGKAGPTQRPPTDVLTFIERLQREGHPIVLEATGDPGELNDSVGASLYRCAQEAITNAFRHGDGTAVHVRWVQSSSMIELTVSNSVGAKAAFGGAAGRGLSSMRHRVELIGGAMTVHAAEGDFEVAISVPLKGE